MSRVAALTACLALVALSQASPERVPVVVELFTSEGCSSCPPADAVLSRLAADQPVAGVQIIPLGMHVTYWDQLGWKDAASLPLATERQQDYSRVFGEDRVYTPQAVIDGREELIGSAEAGVRQAVARASRRPHARIGVRAALAGDALDAEATVSNVPTEVNEKLHAWLIVSEDGLASVVKRGENGGRTLHHDAAVRVIVGSDVGEARLLAFHAPLRREWNRDRLHVAVLLQGKSTRRVWGAAQIVLR